MSQGQLKRRYELLKKPDQTFKDFVVQEIERCQEQLKEAIELAPKDSNSKPFFYTLVRHVARSGMSRTISVHYVDSRSGELQQLNYVTSVLLGLPMDPLRDGVKITGCGMDMGFSIVYDLASFALKDGYAITHRWI